SPLPDDAYQDDWIGDCGLKLVREAAGDGRPWFLQVNFAGPHEPMNITEAMAKSVDGRDVPPPEGGADEHSLSIRRAYTAMIERLDEIVGRFLAVLDETGQREDTIIVFTSDHGEMLGDCGRWEKFVPHQMSIGIPLVVCGPGVARGKISAPATFLDLHATVLDLAGAEPIPGVDSLSMAPQWADPAAPGRDVVFSGLGAWRIAFDGRHKMVAGWDPEQGRRAMED
ncbi:MAG: sulfatase-like hydrolase/transferase, partial [Planctomycetales bacterium]|nr:sulfatase-like hydrolase/transferase [Planctomycetales bacterium]